MMIQNGFKRHWFSASLIIALAVAVYQNISLARINSGIRARTDAALSEPATAGDYVGVVRGVRPDGAYATFEPANRGMLVMTLSSSCGICQRNRPAARALAESARSRGLAVVWVSRDRPTEAARYFDWHASAANDELVVSDPPHSTYQALRLSLVPQTLVVDGRGYVQHAVLGELKLADKDALDQAVARQARISSMSKETQANKD